MYKLSESYNLQVIYPEISKEFNLTPDKLLDSRGLNCDSEELTIENFGYWR